MSEVPSMPKGRGAPVYGDQGARSSLCWRSSSSDGGGGKLARARDTSARARAGRGIEAI